LTIKEETIKGQIALQVPNLVIRRLYAERLCEMLLPQPGDRDDGAQAARQLYMEGKIAPLCSFVEQRYFKVFHNPDYRWANELTVKTAFLTLLFNDVLYIMDSEPEIERRYADLTMIIRPDMRHLEIFDILIEFKFVRLKDAGLTGEQARKLPDDDLKKIPQIMAEMTAAKKQVNDYGISLDIRHGNSLRLKKFAVVSLGFERIRWEEV